MTTSFPHTPEAIQDFIRTLSDAEVREALGGDPLGAAKLTDAGEASDLRWFLFDTFHARPAYYLAQQKHVGAVRAQDDAQLGLFPSERPSPRFLGFIQSVMREVSF